LEPENTGHEKILHEKNIAADRDESTFHVTHKSEIVKDIETPGSEWIHSVYERYAGILYRILIDVCDTNADAGVVMVETFKNLSTNESTWREKGVNLISLVKFAILTARQHASIKDPVCVNCFKQSTLLHYFICENGSMEALCQQSGMLPTDIARQLHLEIQNMRIKL
jgi:hypothetical protein